MAKKINGHTLKPGVKVRITEWTGGTFIGIVEGFESDIKNGRPGIDYFTKDGESGWCYVDQIKEIL
jgi:hypothetical protein